MLYVIANAKSGKNNGRKAMDAISRYCTKENIPLTFLVTERKGHARELAAGLVLGEDDRLATLGGDGTFHEVLNGLPDPSARPIGFIPTGRGNDFAASAHISTDPLMALRAVLGGRTRAIDYIEVGDRRCLNVAGTGLDIEVLVRAEKAKNKLTYLMSLIDCLKHFEATHVSVAVGGERLEFDCVMAGVCNGKCFGGGIKLAPYAEIDDGKLEVIVITMPENGKVMRILPKFVKGKHMGLSVTHRFVADSIAIDTPAPVELDGEIYDDLPFDCRIVKGGLNIYTD